MYKLFMLLLIVGLSSISTAFEIDKTNINNPNNLRGDWKYIEKDKPEYKNIYTDEAEFKLQPVPHKILNKYRGKSWYRTGVLINTEVNEGMVLLLGKIDDEDIVYFNGVEIGRSIDSGTNDSFHSYFNKDRTYYIPATLIKKENTIAVCVINRFLDNGITKGDIGLVSNSYFVNVYNEKYKKRFPAEQMQLIFLAGIFAALAMYHFSLYVILKRKHDLYHTGLLVSFAVYLFMRLENRDEILGIISSNMLAKIDFLSFIFIIMFTNGFIEDFYSVKYKIANRVILGINALFIILLSMTNNTDIMRSVFSVWFAFLVVQIILNIWYTKKSDSLKKKIIRMGTSLLLLASFYDIFYDLKIIDIFGGYIILYGFIALVVSISTASLMSYKEMNDALKEINTKLEERIAERTKKIQSMQHQLVISEKMASIGSLAGGIAHELNSPLGAILTSVQMMKEDISDDTYELSKESFNDEFEIIEAATKQSREIISKLLKYRDERNEEITNSEQDFRGVDINIVIENSIIVCEVEKEFSEEGITLEKEYGVVKRVPGNEILIMQLMTAVLKNSREAIQERGKQGGKISIRTFMDESSVCIEIEDNGVGMSEETRLRMFDPFYTTKFSRKSKGLGLSVAYEILQKHGAAVDVKSEKGKGTKMVMCFPVEG